MYSREQELRERFNAISRTTEILNSVIETLRNHYLRWDQDPKGALVLRDSPDAFIEDFRGEFPGIQVTASKNIVPLHSISGGPAIFIGDLYGRPHMSKKIADRLLRGAVVHDWREAVRIELQERGLEACLPSVRFVKQRVRMIMDSFKRDSLISLASVGLGSGPLSPARVVRELDYPRCSYAIPLSVIYGAGQVLIARAQLVGAKLQPGRLTGLEAQGSRAFNPAYSFQERLDTGALGTLEHHGIRYRVEVGKTFGTLALSSIYHLPLNISRKIKEAIKTGSCANWDIPIIGGRLTVSSRPSSPGSRKGGHIIVFSKYPVESE